MKSYQHWEGTAADLAALADGLLKASGRDDGSLTERMVRYYVQEGLLTRPIRAGREALFGYRQLLELLVTRHLGADGWPLSKIASFNQEADEKALVDVIPRPEEARAGTASGARSPTLPEMARHSGPGEPGTPIHIRRCLEVTIDNWCRIAVDEDALSRLTPSGANRLGRTIAKVLLQTRNEPAIRTEENDR